MIISNDFSSKHIRYIVSHLTQEALQQAKLYGIDDIEKKVRDDLIICDEIGFFLNVNNTPVSCFGVKSKDNYDSLFLLLTDDAVSEYRSFARTASQWLSKRLRPVRCVLPRVSRRTLRMIKVWGFYEVSQTPTRVIMEYNNNG